MSQEAENNDMPSETAAEAPAPVETPDVPDTAALEAQITDLKDKLLRSVAEAENVRRRAERDRLDATRYAAAAFARDMIQVSDNLRRAIAVLKPEEREVAPSSLKALIEGVEVTERQLLSAFERHGIKEVTPQPGDKFDANLHEAMFEVPNSGLPAGSIVHVIEAGYQIGERLLRAARVGVASAEDAPDSGVNTRVPDQG